jgi:putative transposase
LRAGLVKRAEDWPWGSLWQRRRDQVEDRPELATGAVSLPADWSEWVNAPQTAADEAAILRCVRRGQPFGTAAWLEKTAKSFGLQSTQRRPGRPPPGSHPQQLPLFEDNGS